MANKRKFQDGEDTDIVHINLAIRSQDGSLLYFRVNEDGPLSRVFKEFCNRKNLEYASTRFLYDGVRLNGRNTPKTINLENNAEIAAVGDQIGGGVAATNRG